MDDYIEELRMRIKRRFPFDDVKDIIDNKFIIIAGGSFSKEKPHDFDIYPENNQKFSFRSAADSPLFQSKNAKTYKTIDGIILQFCDYKKDTINLLVDSFDFAHCQIGAVVSLENKTIGKPYCTQAFIKSKMLETTWFTGSEYPLASLIRMNKYIKRGHFEGRSWMWETFKILTAILKRGVGDYTDFKDQLDAVDLGLLPEEVEKAGFEDLMELFRLLQVKR